MEQHISIPNANETLDAYVDFQSKKHVIIIMHPHSLMGGNMDNPIVQKSQQIFASKNFSTVRFNFRGVGYSTGVFDEGIGEQDDLKAIISFVKKNGRNQIDLMGYSFGAWVLAHASDKVDHERSMMISPPVAFMDFSKIQVIPKLSHVITGRRDEFAPPDKVQQFIEKWQSDAKLDIIDNADHFYSFHMTEIEQILSKWI